MKATLLIPTLNEIVGLKAIMPRVKENWNDQIIFVDGNSQDGTVQYLEEQGYEHYVQKTTGLKNAYIEVLDKIKGDIVVTFSPDGNCLPEHLPELLAKMKQGYDMIIVSRYKGKAKSYDDDIVTSFGNWLFTFTVNFLFKARYTDVMGIYRAFKKDLIYSLKLNEESSYRSYEKFFFTKISWEPLLSVRAALAKLNIGEIPGDEPARLGGVRKLQVIRWGLAYYLQFFFEYFCSPLKKVP